jgi:hypothetical protein
MNGFKNLLLVTIGLALIALAIGPYFSRQGIADAQESVWVANSRVHPVPVVQVTQWEYKVDTCIGPNLNCYGFTAAGLHGWELVAVSRGRETGTHYTWELVFKRPKQRPVD